MPIPNISGSFSGATDMPLTDATAVWTMNFIQSKLAIFGAGESRVTYPSPSVKTNWDVISGKASQPNLVEFTIVSSKTGRTYVHDGTVSPDGQVISGMWRLTNSETFGTFKLYREKPSSWKVHISTSLDVPVISP